MVLLLTLSIYYVTPFLRWDRGPHAPDQAVLLDFANGRLYAFFVEVWPQDLYLITGLLVLASAILILVNALAGRLWCGVWQSAQAAAFLLFSVVALPW